MQTKDKIAGGKLVSFVPEGFTYDALDGIARDGLRRIALGNDEAQARTRFLFAAGGRGVARRRYNEQRPSGETPALEGGRIFGGAV